MRLFAKFASKMTLKKFAVSRESAFNKLIAKKFKVNIELIKKRLPFNKFILITAKHWPELFLTFEELKIKNELNTYDVCNHKSSLNVLFSKWDFSMFTCDDVWRKFEFVRNTLFRILENFISKSVSDFKKTELRKVFELKLTLKITVSKDFLTQIKTSCSLFERIKFSKFVLDIIKA